MSLGFAEEYSPDTTALPYLFKVLPPLMGEIEKLAEEYDIPKERLDEALEMWMDHFINEFPRYSSSSKSVVREETSREKISDFCERRR